MHMFVLLDLRSSEKAENLAMAFGEDVYGLCIQFHSKGRGRHREEASQSIACATCVQ
jgi:hypothetical protein